MKKLYSFFLASLLSVMFAFAAPTTGLQFSGAATSFIDLGPQAAFSSSQFTVEAWVNYQSLSGAYIISNEGWTNATGSEGFSLRIGGSKMEFVLGANTEWPSLQSTMDIQLDTWYHVAATYSGTEMKLYINGVLDASKTITNPMILSTQNVSIGEGSMWKGRLLNGKLGDLRFWNVVRTDAEIAANMSSSLTGKEAGLVANWKMNEGANSQTIADATGNYNITKPADVAWFVPGINEPITVIAPSKGLVFNAAANSFVDLGAHAEIASPAEFTVEALVNYNSTSGGYIISSEGAPTGATAQGFSLRLNGDKLNFAYGANEQWVQITDVNSVPLNTWVHVAATLSASSAKLYLNGLEVASVDNPAAIAPSTQNVFIGEGSMWKGRALNGKLGYVRMWSVAKTKEQIRESANTYATGNEENLIAAWNNTVSNATALAEVKSAYPGVIGSDVAWFGTTTGVKAINDNSAEIQTRFFGRTVQVTNNTYSKLKLAVYTMTGQKVMEGSLDAGGTYEKELANLKGTFILKCVAENGAVSTKKFILAR